MLKKNEFNALGDITVEEACRFGLLEEMSGTQVQEKFGNYIPYSDGKTRLGKEVTVGDSLVYWDIRKKGNIKGSTTPKDKLTVGSKYEVQKVSWNGNRITVINDLGKKSVVGTDRFVFENKKIISPIDPYGEEYWY
jgi:hypothetical protein